MYAVIMAGGGGTRLHPLSRPERPKPFLPLLGDAPLLAGHRERLAGLVDRRRHGRDRPALSSTSSREQLPDVAPAARTDWAGTPPPRSRSPPLAIDRPDDDVMVVLPADQTIVRDDVFRDVLRTAADDLATGRFGIDDPLVTLGVQVRPAGDRVRLPHPELRAAARPVAGRRVYRCSALRGEAEPGPRRGSSSARPAWPGTRACSCGAAGRSARRSSATPGCSSRSARWSARRRCSSAPTSRSSRPLSIDYAVMEGAAARRPGRDGLDGRRLVRPRVVDGAARGARVARARAVVKAGETVEVGDDDLVVRRDGRAARGHRPARSAVA